MWAGQEDRIAIRSRSYQKFRQLWDNIWGGVEEEGEESATPKQEIIVCFWALTTSFSQVIAENHLVRCLGPRVLPK